MKNFNETLSGFFNKRVLLSLTLFFFLFSCLFVRGQVNFTQTNDADFNRGFLSQVQVGSGAVGLPKKGSAIGSWLTATVLPQTLEGHKMITWKNTYVYLVGGYNGSTYSSSVYKATITGGGFGSWTAQTALPAGLRDHAVVVGTNYIYVIGGRTTGVPVSSIYYAPLSDDGTIGTWTLSTVTLPVPLWGHTATFANGYLYIAGGTEAALETGARTQVYYANIYPDGRLSAFSAGTAMTQAKNMHTAVTYNNKLYVMGGYIAGGTKRNTVYYSTIGVNGALSAWTAGATMPVAVSNHASTLYNGLLTVIGGELTGGTLTNNVYYADIEASPLVWTLSPNNMYDQVKNHQCIAYNGEIVYSGGRNSSGNPILNTRYAPVTLGTNSVANGTFVSNTFFELGDLRYIQSLAYTMTAPVNTSYEIYYRLAGATGVWGSWTNAGTTNPITINQTQRYIQYMFSLSTNATPNNITVNDVTVTIQGSQLAGNLNAIPTLLAANSPYWATADISFTAGTHTIQPGVTIVFSAGTGLEIGQANMICVGTAADSIKFKYYSSGSGGWKGIYFNENSDAGVSSQFSYVAIEGAGNGSWDANLYCYATNEPLLSNSSLRYSDGSGIRLNSSNLVINSCRSKGNGAGILIENSNPTLNNSYFSYNSMAGVYITSSVSIPNYTNTTLNNNLYGIYYPSMTTTLSKHIGTLTMTNNTYNGVCLPGGNTNVSTRWNSLAFPIFIMDNIQIGRYGEVCRLTIEPGNTIKMPVGKTFQIGLWGGYYCGGELYALGTIDSLITFTSINGTAGGWEGMYFEDRSDWNGSASVMDYCVVEKGNAYNMYIENTYQPSMNHCTIRNGAQDGIKFYGAYNTVMNSSITSNGRYPIYYSEPHTFPTLHNNTYTGNTINLIGYCGGSLTENRTFQNDGIGYHIMDNMTVGRYGEVRRLTIEPGLTLHFATGKGLQVGLYSGYYHGGELYAVGKADSIITFTPYSGVAGDWNGIYFDDRSDWNGATNQLNYCTIQKANAYNIYVENTGSVTIQNCNIKDAVTDGLRYYGGYGSFTNCTFSNNGRYPVYYTEWSSEPVHSNNTFLGKGVNMIALSGGSYTESRTISKDNAEYLVLDNIIIGRYGDIRRLTVQSGVTLNFASGKGIQVGLYSGYYHGGELYAEGNLNNWVTFRPASGIIGDWTGIFFEDRSNWNGATSSLKYCIIEKGNSYNIYSDYTNQPTIENCIIRNSANDGIKINFADINIKKTIVSNNTTRGIYISGTYAPTIGNAAGQGNDIFNNGSYNVYNDGSTDVNARFNFWGSMDSTVIASRIFDINDDASKGRVIISYFASAPQPIQGDSVKISGKLWYANTSSTPLNNATMALKDYANVTVASTTTNALGNYSLAKVTAGAYKMSIAPSTVWGGANATDALGVLNHFAQITPLTMMRYSAADVNKSMTVNGTDALLILKRFGGLISTFPSGDWLWDLDTTIVNGENITEDYYALCFGDVNASYLLTMDADPSVNLNYDGMIITSSGMDFDLPVKVNSSLLTNAISIGFTYPDEYLEVIGVTLANGNSDLIWTAENGLFRMGWCDLAQLNLGSGEICMTLHLKAKDLSGITEDIQLGLFEETEFADGSTNVIQDLELSIPVIGTIMTGIPNTNGNNFYLSDNYPNPSNGNTNIMYSIPADGFVSMKVFNQTGQTVSVLVSQNMGAGQHSIDLDCSGLEAGIYYYKIEFKGTDNAYSTVKKMVVTR